MSHAEVFWLNGPVIKARAHGSFHMKEAVRVGGQQLVGEVIRLEPDAITIQVFEDTTGLQPGAIVEGDGLPLAVELGPGLLGAVFDGIQQPLKHIAQQQGNFISPGAATVTRLDRSRTWSYRPLLQAGAQVHGGEVLGEVQETSATLQRILIPPRLAGICIFTVEPGDYTIETPLAVIRTDNGTEKPVSMLQRWPIREPRPYLERSPPSRILFTGQRILDTLYPVGRGGAALMPGGFGTGKTILQQSLAKWCAADVIIYIGCGERGNEMAEILDEFPQLEDPRSGKRLMERTVVIANTSNMPVAAREASIYTGITLAEFYRDQGLQVALFADSVSRWAEALREISSRLEELPAEEGYPAYLPTRLAEFFERAGDVTTLAGTQGSVTVMAAVSPPGGDFSEPVTAHAQRFVKTLWALDSERAQARFYPAVHPLTSYSGYVEEVAHWWEDYGGLRWEQRRRRVLMLLEQQARLQRMVKIIGRDALDAEQRLILVSATVVTEGLLRQSAFSATDRYCPPQKQAAMLALLDHFLNLAQQSVAAGADPDHFCTLPVVRRLQRMGEDIANDRLQDLEVLRQQLDDAFAIHHTAAEGQ